MKEILDQTDFDSYFDEPSLENVPLSIKKQIWRIWREGFESIKKIFDIAGGCRCCGSCCVDMPVRITPVEIARIARYLNHSVNEVFNEYCRWYEDQIYLKTPCPFLIEDKKCSIYSARPTLCKFFPIKPIEANFVIVFRPDCPFGQTIFQYWEKYSNSPEIKEMFERERKEQSSEVKEYIKKVGEESEAEIERLPPEATKKSIPSILITSDGLECFADWLEKHIKLEG